MSQRVRTLALTFALGCAGLAFSAAPAAAAASPRPEPRFLAPESRVVTGRTILLVEQRNPDFDSSEVTRVTFELSADQGRRWSAIHEVSGLDANNESFDPDRWEALWDPTDLAPGRYLVRVGMSYLDGETIRTRYRCRAIVVNAPPVIRSVMAAPGPIPGQVQFDGGDVTDVDGRVVSWRWDFGDPVANEEADFSAGGRRAVTVFLDQNRCYSVNLTITDDSGGETAAYFQLCWGVGGIAIAAPPPPPECVCKSIKVRTSGMALGRKPENKWPPKSGIYDGKKLGPLDGNDENKAPNGEKKHTGFAFEILAEVEDDPSKCKETQLIKRTRTPQGGAEQHVRYQGRADRDLDGTFEMNVTNETTCRDAGGSWGLDLTIRPPKKVCQFPQSGDRYIPESTSALGSKFANPGRYKTHQGKRALWTDVISFDDLADGSTYIADFIAMLRGDNNEYCYVKFRVDLQKKAGMDIEMISPAPNGAGEIVGITDAGSVPGVP